ncbi:alpha-amylase family glycosyl hydrolase [Ferrimonas marina]|uniref:Glycosidase n=1 Tax=Ferrimonas marina TaxID=299255 RepID=A0A1M5VI06_9GAMM|nr:alpha-amylase family glycosyl hydrolase [Ferrimonas marina]SHH74825.1 Glycosidase [Ferrimonas marina]
MRAILPLSALTLSAVALGLAGCAPSEPDSAPQQSVAQAPVEVTEKLVVYQMFTRLFGNTVENNVPWGTAEQNGVGKFNDITDEALAGIKQLGTTHLWYTGVPHHALVADYTQYGISNDDPDVIKGRAGSPYAVKDYYSVNPDLAEDPANRMAEFKALVERTHAADMKVLIDIVPNHVARQYESLGKPEGVENFGASDDTSVAYARDNNFYYVVGEEFSVPDFEPGFEPLGGQSYPGLDGQFAESPAKWTGNGSRSAKPHVHDWYETVKINYGVRPDGSHDFPSLPDGYADKSAAEHYAFWQGQDVPDSWTKFRDITLFWTEFGIDGFRFDMAEMVPVEFWSYLNSHIKHANPEAFLLAEVYQPHLYRDYLHLGKMDYLYDKVDLYDKLKDIIQGNASTDAIVAIEQMKADIEHHMLHFLENHDEQRIASPDFAGSAERALPAMVLSATLSTAPTMLYFGQDVGEAGEGDAGFGKATRTTIFDYWGVPAHQRWMNGGKFDGGQLSEQEKALRDYYIRLMDVTTSAPAMMGKAVHTHTDSRNNPGYTDKTFSYVRFDDEQKLIIASNFSDSDSVTTTLTIPSAVTRQWGMPWEGEYALNDLLNVDGIEGSLKVHNHIGTIELTLAPLQSVIWEVQP